MACGGSATAAGDRVGRWPVFQCDVIPFGGMKRRQELTYVLAHGQRIGPFGTVAHVHQPYSGNGCPFVSGANGKAARPTRNTRHMVTPA